ncbi:Fanconi anemia group A protein, partial [Silurus meridionalis]
SESEEQGPQVGVHTQLMQLKRLLSTGAAEGEIRAQISLLSQTLIGVCDHLEKQSECEIRTLILDPHTTLHTPKIVNVILQGFCECVLAACRFAPPNKQCQWVEVFLKMLIGHTQLYTHILHRVLQLLYLQGPSLSPAHVLSLVVLVVELHVCRDQIPPVDLFYSTCLTHSTRLSPSEALSDVLPVSTASAMDFSLRFCVLAVCYALCKSSSHTEELSHFIPSRLYKRLLFLMPRLMPELRSGVLAAVRQADDDDDDDKGADEDECEGAWASVSDCSRSVRSSVKSLWGHTTVRNLQKHLEHQGDRSVSRAKILSVQLITLLADSSDWLSLFHQSGCSMEHGSGESSAYNSVVSMVTTDLCVRLMPFALFSVLVDVDASVLSRVMVTPGFLLHAAMSYSALMKLFLFGHSADVEAECMELDPEVAAALSALMNTKDLS